jgi:glyoxylase-like metal-dependent hydrolase (beta-lactamase superfamily II)
MEIYSNIHMISGLASKQYLIVDPDGITLIDAGLPGDYKKILTYMNKLGYPPSKLHQIFITHADGDHYGGVNGLKKFNQSVIVRSSNIEARAMEKGVSSRTIAPKGLLGLFFKMALKIIRSVPTEVMGDMSPGMELPIMGGLEVLDTSGHTPGHLSFYLKVHGILFAGDSILVHGNDLVPSAGANTWDLDKARIAFQKQISLDPGIIAGGHGMLKRK